MYGQTMELRRLLESTVGGAIRGIPVPASDARIRIRALTEIAARHMGDLASTSREDKDFKVMEL